ncbi:MAG TPA: hypothetical protein VFL83_23030 [Anaeromyxobacter sp.]|nr:hypothetical protein [Anaeromyxobacter sp.]
MGSDAAQTFTSVRAGLRRMQERPGLYACRPAKPALEQPAPLVASAITHLDARARREGRPAEWLAFLAAQAFRDLERRARLSPADGARLGVFLALPARPGLGAEQRDELAYHFHNHAERDLLPAFEVSFGGHAAALAAAERAAAAVSSGRLGAAAVGAADSWLFRPWLEAADADWRLLCPRNPDGFQPGEAAAFFLLEPAADAARRGAAPLAHLGGSAAARRDASKGLPDAGAALASAVGELLRPGAGPVFVCDLNGEARRAKEWALAVGRLGRRLEGGFAVEHPASVLGDVGAAAGAVQVALAVQWLATKHAGRPAVVWAASEDGERRALALERA